MRVVVVFEVDEEAVIHSMDSFFKDEDMTLEDAMHEELNWVKESGIYTVEIISEDSLAELSSNDQTLGAYFRNLIKNGDE